MTPVDLIQYLIDYGGKVKNSEAEAMLAYFDTLLRRERVVLVKDRKTLVGFCTFFLLTSQQDVNQYYYRAPWTTPTDESTGTVCLIDLVVARRWDKALRRHLEDVIVWRFPQIREAVWYRVVDDRTPDRVCRRMIRREPVHATTI